MDEKAKIIEHLMIEALDKIMLIAPLIKEIPELDRMKNVQRVGRAICELHDIRDEIYSLYPEIKPDIAKEVEADGWQEYGEKQKEIEEAYLSEETGDIEKANQIFQSILSKYDSGSFKMQAEAGLYRCRK